MGNLELNKAVLVTASNRNAVLSEAIDKGFEPLSSGLGVVDGEYKFTTVDNPEFAGIMPVHSTARDRDFALTFLVGSLSGENLTTPKQYNDKSLFVVTAEVFSSAKPNTTYDVVVANGRVTACIESKDA